MLVPLLPPGSPGLWLFRGCCIQQARGELLQQLQVGACAVGCLSRPHASHLHRLQYSEALALGEELIPLLGLQFLAYFVVLRVRTFLAEQGADPRLMPMLPGDPALALNY